MKKIFLLIICIFTLLTNTSYAKTVKFVQITDVQYGKENSKEILSEAISEINELKDVSFVVFTGDNTNSASINNTKSFLKAAKKLNKPFYIINGDRDVSKSKHLTKEVYAELLHRELGIKSPKTLNYTFEKENILFIVVDGSKDFITMPNGYFNKQTLNWLENQLKNTKKKKVVILQHFPIANECNNEMLCTSNAIEYIKLINKYNKVISVISGHFNKNDEVMRNGIYHITTPSLYSNRTYKVIEIDDENGYQIFTSLIEMEF